MSTLLCLHGEHGQISIQYNIGKGIDQRPVMDDQEHLETN